MEWVTGHFVVISTFTGLENVHAIKKNVMTAKKSKKETGPCFSRTKMFCLTSKFVYVTAKFSEIPCVLFSFTNR